MTENKRLHLVKIGQHFQLFSHGDRRHDWYICFCMIFCSDGLVKTWNQIIVVILTTRLMGLGAIQRLTAKDGIIASQNVQVSPVYIFETSE